MLENEGAGVFGSWTNIWGVGMVMFALMTRAVFPPDNRIRRWVSTPTKDEPDLRTETYGYHLDETWDSGRFGPRSAQAASLVTDYDKDLRVLVMRCMAYDAFERPNLEELLNTIEAAIKEGDEKDARGDVGVKETNAQLEAFYDLYFHSAPEKPDPWEGNYD
ncbi:hypothetical protein PG990_012879 [Apiospora arundinis]|uniref:Kinase-like domain-containing protein n=1 Tax=Apiospora arundinis TaxID=335852 RepID=A0ABR2HSF9_9PEZI